MSEQGRRIDYPPLRETEKSRRPLFVSPVAAVNGRLVRPNDLLVETRRDPELDELLLRNNGRRYEPGKEETDFRQREGAPPYGNINERLREKNAGFELWTGFDLNFVIEQVENKRQPGLSYNHVFVGEDFYHGGPGGAPTEVAGPPALPEWTGDGIADVAVLDNGLPGDWKDLHAELSVVVNRLDADAVPEDPLDELHDGILDKQAGHGLFICGLINRVAPELNINLHRVLHASGEGDESLITDTLLELKQPAFDELKVINLSLGAYIPGTDGPRLEQTIRDLKDQGKVIVASAGNCGDDPIFGPGALFPARMPEVIAVGAFDSETQERWEKSCWADVYAPGVDIYSAHVKWTGGIDWAEAPGPHAFVGWAKWSGTSFAAPLVAAALATVLGKPHAKAAWDVAQDWLAALQRQECWTNKSGGELAPVYDTPQVTDWV